MNDMYARLGDLPLEAVGEDELTEHWQTAIHDEVARDMRSVELQFPADTRVVFAAEEHKKTPSIWDRIEAWLDRWTLRIVATVSIAVFSYVGLAYFDVIPVVPR
jgi:hypothetical protein